MSLCGKPCKSSRRCIVYSWGRWSGLEIVVVWLVLFFNVSVKAPEAGPKEENSTRNNAYARCKSPNNIVVVDDQQLDWLPPIVVAVLGRMNNSQPNTKTVDANACIFADGEALPHEGSDIHEENENALASMQVEPQIDCSPYTADE